MKTLDLLLVNPAYLNPSPTAGIEPPWFIGILASIARRQGRSVKILDCEAEGLTPQMAAWRIGYHNAKKVQIYALGINPAASSTTKMPFIIELCRLVKAQIGGLHVNALPMQSMQETGAGIASSHIETLEPIAFDLMPMDKYKAHNWQGLDGSPRKPYATTYTSLGCPYSCSFCNIHALYGDRKVRYRPTQDVVSEIDLLVNKYKVRNIKIVDELFTLNKKHVHDICDLIIGMGYDLNMWAYARVGTLDIDLLKKMRRAGIRWLGYGFESANPTVLEGVGKSYKDIDETIEMTREAGIYIGANFIFGLPDDDMDSMRATLDWAKEGNFEWVNFYVAMAYPGSQLYDNAIREGIPLPATWEGYSQYSPNVLPLPTKYLRPADVLKFRDEAFIDYYSDPKYQNMMRLKFGEQAVEKIKEMLKWKVKRVY